MRRILASAVFLFALCACEPTPAPTTSTSTSTSTSSSTTTTTALDPFYPRAWIGAGPRIAIVGDSLIIASTVALEQAFPAEGFTLSATGLLGKSTIGAQPTFDHLEPMGVPVALVNLGTRDIEGYTKGYAGFTLPEIEARFRSIADQFPDACFMVTTVNSHRTNTKYTNPAVWNAGAEQLNSFLQSTFPGHVVEWNDVAFAHTTAGTTILDGAEIHPNEAGRPIMAQLYVEAARRCLAEP